MKRLALFLAAVLAAAPSLAQHVVPVLPGSSIGAMTSQRLRLVPMTGTNGTLEATGTANVAKLNAWTATGWKVERLARIDFEGRGIGISGTWDLGNVEAIRINGSGLPDYRSEDYFPTTGGPAARLVWLPRGSQAGPMIRMRGQGFTNDGVALYGNWRATDLPALKLDTAHRVDVALEIQGQQGGSGVGHFYAPNLMIGGAETGIKSIRTPVQANSDQGKVDAYLAVDCHRGFWSISRDALGWEFGLAKQYNTDTMFEYSRGGDFHCDTLLPYGPLSKIGLKITGNDRDTGEFSFGDFEIERCKIDDTLPADFRLLVCQPTQDDTIPGAEYSGYPVKISRIRGSASRTSGVLIEIDKSYGDFTFDGGWLMYPRFVKVTGGISTHCPTFRFYNLNFITGSAMNDVRNFFSTDSTGFVKVISQGNVEMTGYTGQVNNGKFYLPFEALIEFTGPNSYVIH